jgi:O-antigen/teichoic acid export membrane protein
LVTGLTARIFAVGALALLVVYAARTPLSDRLGVTDLAALPIFATSVVTNLLFLISHAALLGRFRWRAAIGLPVALGAIRLVFSVALLMSGYGVSGVFAAIAASNVVCFVVAYALAIGGLPRGARYRPLHVSDVGITGAISAAFWFLVHVDTVYVNSELPSLAARGYAAASTLARPVVYFPAAVNQVLFPFLTSAGGWTGRRVVLSRMLATAIAVDLAALAVLAAAPRPILEATFGAAYGGASDMLVVIAAVLALYSLVNVVFYDALARNDRWLMWVLVAVAALAGLLLALVPPSIDALFTILAAGAVLIIGAGLRRMRSGPDSRGEGGAESR